MHQTIQMLEQIHRRGDLPDFHPGDTVKVFVRVREGDKERLQMFEGYVIGRKGNGIHETFTVRKISYGIGVERIFPVHSPKVFRLEIVARGRVRRAKLNYLRALKGKAAKISERKTWLIGAVNKADDTDSASE